MIKLSQDTKVYLALGHTDMLKSIGTLSILVSEHLGLDIFNGSLFVFCNRKLAISKLIYWDQNGFCLWQKRLEKDLFKWPQTRQDVMTAGNRELTWLIQGLNISQAHKPLNFSTVH